jgi:phage-related protein
MKEVFGYRPGQGAADFMKELRELTPEDRRYFAAELNKAGYPTEDPK